MTTKNPRNQPPTVEPSAAVRRAIAEAKELPLLDVGRLMALIGNLQAGQEATYTRIFQNLNPEPHLAPLRSALRVLSVKEAASAVAFMLKLPRRQVYQRALALAAEGDGDA